MANSVQGLCHPTGLLPHPPSPGDVGPKSSCYHKSLENPLRIKWRPSRRGEGLRARGWEMWPELRKAPRGKEETVGQALCLEDAVIF